MPTIPTPKLPEWADPSQESVFDPLYETLIKRATSIMGGDDPQGLVGQVTPTPLISKIPFKDVPIKNAQLRYMLEQQKAPEELHKAVEFASKRYPRTLAHVLSVRDNPSLEAFGMSYNAKQSPKSFIHVNPESHLRYGQKKPGDLAETFGHELTHAAQTLWDVDAAEYAYPTFNKHFGYNNNVMEHGANKAGSNFKKRFLADLPNLSTPPPEAVRQAVEPTIMERLLAGANYYKNRIFKP